uniref:Secreted protein n=1 Tax=Heterorhabditis bacteriophora TaxID=37862 RepID=A0A1I7WZW5_HETBA
MMYVYVLTSILFVKPLMAHLLLKLYDLIHEVLLDEAILRLIWTGIARLPSVNPPDIAIDCYPYLLSYSGQCPLVETPQWRHPTGETIISFSVMFNAHHMQRYS